MVRMSMTRLGTLLALLLVQVGCGARDPVSSLKNVVDVATARLESKPIIFDISAPEPKFRLPDEKPFRRWVYKVEPAGIKIDVIKTDSLVTPYKGTVQLPVREVFSDFATRNEAEAFDKSFDMSDFAVEVWLLQYDYTDERWQLVDGKAEDESWDESFNSSGGRPLMRVKLERLRE